MQKNVVILPGFCEGKWHIKKLQQELSIWGYKVTNSSKAKVAITHSGGIYLNEASKAYDVLLVTGLPYNPLKGMIKAIPHKLRIDYHHFRVDNNLFDWCKKMVAHVFYFFRHFRLWSRMTKNYSPEALSRLKAKKIILAINRDDVFASSSELEQLARDRGWEYHMLSGAHDDIWNNPRHYVKLLTK